MSSSGTSRPRVAGIAASGGSLDAAESIARLLEHHGWSAIIYRVDRGDSELLEMKAGCGHFGLVVELGMEDFLEIMLSAAAKDSTRLTGAIRSGTNQVWVVMDSFGKAGDWDLAGRQLAWLASASIRLPDVIFNTSFAPIETMARSFEMWALPSIRWQRTTMDPFALACDAVRRAIVFKE